MPDKYNHLQKCAQLVARLCDYLQGNIGHKLLFDNWFITIEFLIYLKEIGILAVGTVRAIVCKAAHLNEIKLLKSKAEGLYTIESI